MKKLSADLKQFIPYLILLIGSTFCMKLHIDIYGQATFQSIVPIIVFGMAFGIIFTLLSKPSKSASSVTAVYALLVGSIIMFIGDRWRIKLLFVDHLEYTRTLNPMFGKYNQFLLISKFLFGVLIAVAIVTTINIFIKKVKPQFKAIHILYVLAPILICYSEAYLVANTLSRAWRQSSEVTFISFFAVALIAAFFTKGELSLKFAITLLAIAFVLSPLFARGIILIFKVNLHYLGAVTFVRTIVTGAVFGIAIKCIKSNLIIKVKTTELKEQSA